MKKFSNLLIGGIFLSIGGALLGIGPAQDYWQNKYVPRVSASPFAHTAAVETTAPKAADLISGRPVRVTIPALNLDLPVAEGYYNAKKQTWTLSKDKAHYAVVTPLANNQQGNTFIYGHNRREVFSTLHRLRLDDQVVITTDNGHTFTYRFMGALETVPSDDSLFHYQGKPILTIQTCSGVWYQHRQLFTFNLETAL